MSAFLDTNILVYSISATPADQRKRAQSEMLLARPGCVLSVQVLQEFYVQATNTRKAHYITHDKAVAIIARLKEHQVVGNTKALLDSALALRPVTNFSFWDCAVIAAAIAGGCDILYTEDMQHGREVEGVRIVNSFLSEAEA